LRSLRKFLCGIETSNSDGTSENLDIVHRPLSETQPVYNGLVVKLKSLHELCKDKRLNDVLIQILEEPEDKDD
jgi:hypothetical protein